MGTLSCDYTYSLAEAIKEDVCRIPQITAIDNSNLYYESSEGASKYFDNIETLLDSGIPFQQVLENDSLATYLLGCGVQKLLELKRSNPKAAGLIVASNISHAYHLASILRTQFDENAVVITSDDKYSSEMLAQFKNGKHSWVVSVAMVSEGTNIPRLQVCCYLSRVKTELYFRQVLGRVLRSTKDSSRFAYFYMLAEPNLLKFARRADDDIPNENILLENAECILQTMDSSLLPSEREIITSETKEEGLLSSCVDVSLPDAVSNQENLREKVDLGSISAGKLSIYGSFLEQLIKLEGTVA